MGQRKERTEDRQDSWRGDGTENRQDRELTGQLEEMGQIEKRGDRPGRTNKTDKRQYDRDRK
jgi:hypothetical protein